MAAGPILLGDADGQVKLIRSRGEMSGLEQVLMDLGHDAAGTGTSLRDRVEDSDTGAGVSHDNLLEFAEWVYLNVEEVWSGFNLVADAVAKGARFRGNDAAGEDSSRSAIPCDTAWNGDRRRPGPSGLAEVPARPLGHNTSAELCPAGPPPGPPPHSPARASSTSRPAASSRVQ